MFKFPQDTSVNKGIDTRKLKEQLLKYFISIGGVEGLAHSQFKVMGNEHDDYYLIGLTAGNDLKVDPFFDPIELTYGDDTLLIIDVRPATRFDRGEQQAIVNNPSLYRREQTRLVLQSIWLGESSRSILALGTVQVKLFATWIAESVSRRYGLDPEQQMKLLVGAALYYLSLFATEDKFDLGKANLVISRVLGLNLGLVQEVTNGIGYIADAHKFTEAFTGLIDSPRLSGVDVDVLITLLNGSWFGSNSTALIATAVEYPPTFVALIYLALTDRSAKLTGLAVMAKKFENNPATKEFITMTSNTLKNELGE